MPTETKKGTTPDEARIACIRTALKEGFDMAKPDLTPWLVQGVEILKVKGDITVEDLQEIDKIT